MFNINGKFIKKGVVCCKYHSKDFVYNNYYVYEKYELNGEILYRMKDMDEELGILKEKDFNNQFEEAPWSNNLEVKEK